MARNDTQYPFDQAGTKPIILQRWPVKDRNYVKQVIPIFWHQGVLPGKKESQNQGWFTTIHKKNQIKALY